MRKHAAKRRLYTLIADPSNGFAGWALNYHAEVVLPFAGKEANIIQFQKSLRHAKTRGFGSGTLCFVPGRISAKVAD